MREQVLDYIQTLPTTGYAASKELPWSNGGDPLFITNLKRIYVDRPQLSIDPIIQTLSGVSISNETTTLRVIFSTDAKKLPPNYSVLVDSLKNGKDIDTILGVNRRECQVSTEFQGDTLVTTVELRFTKLI